MRVAIVSREVIPFFGAGIGTYAAEMSRAWAEAGHEVHFLSENHSGFLERGPALLNATCHAISHEPDEFYFAAHAKGVRKTLTQLHAKSPFDYIEFPDYWAEGYHAIASHRVEGELPGAVLGIRLHTPTLECRALNNEPCDTRELAHLNRAEAAAIRMADFVASPSRSLLDKIQSRLPLRAPTFVIPYPFRADSISSGAPTPCDRPTVLYIGRLERRKGVELLVHAAQQLLATGTDLNFRFIGGDTQTGPNATSMLSHLQSQISPHNRDRFLFEPRRPRSELFNIVRGVTEAGGVCCFPSLWENFPNACLEAMSLGATVVGSDAGGMSEIIENNVSGLLFRSGDAASLDATLKRAIDDNQLRRSISANAPRRIANLCNPVTIVTQMIQAIEAARTSPDFGKPRDGDELAAGSVRTRIRRLAAKVLGRR